MALCSKRVVDYQLYTIDNGLQIIKHCSALGLFTILTLINSQQEEEEEFFTPFDPHTTKIIITKEKILDASFVAPTKGCFVLGRLGIGVKLI